MSVIDLITRVEAICKKYEKYDIDKQKEVNVSGDDAFAPEKNGATAVAINTEIRRTKARLIQELPKLQRLALKKVKGLSKEELEARTDLVSALKERIEAIPNGSTNGAKQIGGWAASASSTEIKFDTTSDKRYDSEYFQQTEESNNFRNEYEMRKTKQDTEGLVTLKNMAHDMNEILSICLGIWHWSIEKSNATSTEETVQCPKSVLTSHSQVWIMLCVGSA
ncbi:Syntaxin-71 [Camellia lanceoleosa]|uniref:Syntaxin-71 n=1 Tax=Camellia lanceoleosa TaxID=1840588 RepID=A0ACC0F2X2_9ERIC|nr:Syntaxin-71 [Camellia lanceoleosa]